MTRENRSGRRERPRRVVNDDDAGALRHLRERVRDRVLPPRAAVDDAHRFSRRNQVGRRRPCEIGRQRDHDLVDLLVAVDEVEAALKDGAIAKREHLLGHGRAEPRAPARRGKNGRHEHDPDYRSMRGLGTSDRLGSDRLSTRLARTRLFRLLPTLPTPLTLSTLPDSSRHVLLTFHMSSATLLLKAHIWTLSNPSPKSRTARST